ncbi:MAG: response regulator [Pseudomonadota bacterium]
MALPNPFAEVVPDTAQQDASDDNGNAIDGSDALAPDGDPTLRLVGDAEMAATDEADGTAQHRDEWQAPETEPSVPPPSPRARQGLHTLMAGGFWLGLTGALVALILLMMVSLNNPQAVFYLVVGMIVLTSFVLVGVVMRAFSPILLTGVVPRVERQVIDVATQPLAGAQTLSALGLAEQIIANDRDARLVTRRDGVVVFGNDSYQKLAAQAHVMNEAGIPPRIERLFAQQGAESMKIFRLCRAARSGNSACEDIYQLIGFGDQAKRRRFEVCVAPIKNDENHSAWTLRELPVDEEEHDALAAAYADYLRPIFAVERSGQIAWSNAAMREQVGAAKGSLHHIDDVILGETAELVEALWTTEANVQTAQVRRQHAGPIAGDFRAFSHGGAGEGFVCVELTIEEEATDTEELTLSGDVAEAPFGVAIVEGEFGKDAKIVEANKAFTDVFGQGARRPAIAKLLPADVIDELAREVKRRTNNPASGQVIEARVGDGPAARVYALHVKPVSRRRGAYGSRRALIFSNEVTARKQMELDHGQDQKLKAIGNLAGEVAHDFNNFLQTILGNCELLMMNHPVGDPSYEQLVVIRENSQRLANLTKQLLAFSRKQTMQRRVLSITELLRDFTKFLDRAVGEKVRLELINGRGLHPVKVDQNQLESAIMNLAVNARDAMGPGGGKLTIRTAHIPEADIAATGIAGLAPQDHVMIELSDTGPGVPEDIASKIFDPFFTTKEVGKGTGLGLSTVYGVIGQMGGAIMLDTTAEKGATFRLYLPAFMEADGLAIVDDTPEEVADLTGNGRILVVEDEDAVRGFVVTALRGRGYEVEEACDGTDALDLMESEGADTFDLIISDVMMLEMDGPVFVRKAREQFEHHPRIIFMSGYAETAMRDQIDDFKGAGYLQKPFAAKDLAARVKEMVGVPDKKAS